MAEYVKLPTSVDFDSQHAYVEWTNFVREFENFLAATKRDEEEEKVKIALMLNILGTKALALFDTFSIADEERKSYSAVKKAFENYVAPKINETFERFVFNQRVQEEGENFEHFFAECRRLIKNCGFARSEPQEDSLLRDRIVFGVRDKAVQEALLRMEDLSLEKAATHCRAVEQSRRQAKLMRDSTASAKEDVQVDVVVQKKRHGRRNLGNTENNYNKSECGRKGAESKKFQCNRCQTKHAPRECPAYGRKCDKCGMLNHFAISCRVKNVRHVEVIDSDSDSSSLSCYAVNLCVDAVGGNLSTQYNEWVE
ncbi:uncharacterized protein LOC124173947 [Ischnura elegans]|uniref:uncharacterized protein LOC124173947 n=1 Tax=Ischnura elegans TaxID=197161 RepID=UPI001ED8A1E5|nr:uncharacterized protein LOC124173947 [Ischnura elegans]